MGLKAKAGPKKYKKARYAIRNFSNKDLSNIIREFEKPPYESYERKSPKNEPTDSYFYQARQLENFMMRADSLNVHVYPVIREMTDMKQIPTLQIYSKDGSKLKESLVDKTWLQIYYTNVEESIGIIVYECYMEEDKSECINKNINKQRNANNEADYEES